MQEVKPTPTPYAAPVAAHGDGPAGSSPIFETPIYITVARGFILFFSLVIMALSGMLMHGLVMDAYAFSLVVGLFSIIIVVWELVSEKIPSCHKAYNYWAVLSLDLLMAIFWLSSMGANAANRASFTVSVNADCYSTGAALNSGKCVVSKRGLEKRAAVATAAGLASMSAIAGLSALVMLLFIAPLVVIGHQVRKHLEAKKAAAAPNDATVEMKAQSQPMLAQQQQQQQAPAPIAPQFTGNTSYTSQTGYGQHQPQQQPYDAYAYAQAQAGHHQQAPIPVPTPVPTQQHGYPQGGPTPVPQEHYQYGVPPQQPSPATPLAYPQHPQQPQQPQQPHYEMPHSSAAGTPTNPQELPYQQPAQR